VNGAQRCGATTTVQFAVGTEDAPAQDTTNSGGTLKLSCKVVGLASGGYDVSLHLDSEQGG
jgi:hypothetical protein